MTGKVAVKVVDNEKVNMVCALGLPLGIENIVKMARVNDKFIALNGCPVKCASKTLDHIGYEDYRELVFTTSFGIQKNKNFSDETNLAQAEARVKEMLKESEQ
jgi:uncharacterized metal-binding protein